MKRPMPQVLIQSLLAVLITVGALLVVDSSRIYALDTSLVGDESAVCADVRRSANDPEVSLTWQIGETIDAGYHDTQILIAPPPAVSQPRRTHFARAPPAPDLPVSGGGSHRP